MVRRLKQKQLVCRASAAGLDRETLTRKVIDDSTRATGEGDEVRHRYVAPLINGMGFLLRTELELRYRLVFAR